MNCLKYEISENIGLLHFAILQHSCKFVMKDFELKVIQMIIHEYQKIMEEVYKAMRGNLYQPRQEKI